MLCSIPVVLVTTLPVGIPCSFANHSLYQGGPILTYFFLTVTFRNAHLPMYCDILQRNEDDNVVYIGGSHKRERQRNGIM